MERYEPERQLTGTEIAVIGMSCRFPGARNPDEYWRILRDGIETVSFLTADDLDSSGMDAAVQGHSNYVKAAPLLGDQIQLFDAPFFGITPREAEIMDPQHRLFLELSWEALESSGYDPDKYPEAVGVFAGARTNTYLFNLFSNPEALKSLGAFEIGLGNDLAFLSTRVAYQLGLRGPAYSVHTACSTGLVAVHLACQSLLIDECRMALAGGVAINLPQKTGYLYQEGGILSPDGHCRAFDAAASGTIFGSGAGVVVLKRLEDALADGDKICALIKGSAVNNDGALKANFTAPGVDGQTRVISEAATVAGVDSETISYVEAHGTGTQLGDAIEIRALTKAFRASTDKKNFCAVGSVKTNFGHLDAAAGIAGLIKTVLALQHRQLPPTLHFQQPNPKIDFAGSPFYVNQELTPWEGRGGALRAGVSSFGIGGTNAHLILEQAPPSSPSGSSRPWHLLTLSTKSPLALESATTNLADHLKTQVDLNPADVAYTLAVGRKEFDHRRMIVCRDREDALAALAENSPRVFAMHQQTRERPVVFMFPGGGAQYFKMGAELYQHEPAYREEVDHCCRILQAESEFDWRKRLSGELGPEDAGQMTRTGVGLPALFIVEYAMARLLMLWGIEPEAMIGHSLGEYVAACLAGVFSLEEALSLTALRGRLFEQLPEGAMLSIPLAERQLKGLSSEKLSLAAVNGPSQCVVSGPVEAIEEMADALRERELEFRRVRIEVAAHSEMVEAILEPFGEFFGKFQMKEPKLPYLSNLTGSWIRPGEATQVDYWKRHLRETVRFGEGIERLLENEDRLLLEVGPGQSLSSLAKLQLNGGGVEKVLGTMRHPHENRSDVEYLLTTAGKLWLQGVKIEWPAFYCRQTRRRVPLPTYTFERQRYWIDAEKDGIAKTTSVNPGKNPIVTDWFYLPSWKRTAAPGVGPTPPPTPNAPQTWLIFLDDCGLGSKLAEELKQAGHDVAVVVSSEKQQTAENDRYLIDPRRSEDYESVLLSLREQGREPNKIIHLWSVMSDDTQAENRLFQKVQEPGYYSLLFLTRALVKQGRGDLIQIEVVGNAVYSVNDEASLPEKATILAPCLVVPQEYPNLIFRHIDLVLPPPASPSLAHLVGQLIAEFRHPSPDPVVAYRAGRRWIRHYEPFPLYPGAESVRSFRQNGVYLITGGLGGVGLILAEYLARTVQAKLILTRQSPFPATDQWAEWLLSHGEDNETSRKIRRLQALEDLGAEVSVACLDVADEQAMGALTAQIYEKFGCLNGVLHAAGVTHGTSLYRSATEIGAAESEAQFRPKVFGVYALEKVLRGKDLDFCLLFSSNAAVLGGLGFLSYTAANLFMDAFAASRNQTDSFAWISADWDHWPEETRQYAGIRTGLDQYTMTRDESEEAFRRVVCVAPEGQIVVSTGNLASRIGLWAKRKTTLQGQNTGGNPERSSHQRPRLQTGYTAPRNDLEQAVAEVWQQVLGLRQVGIHDNFFDLGGHSLLLTQILGRLRDSFEIDLPLSKLFEYPTVAGLAEVIANMRTEVKEREKTEVLKILSQLTDEEVEAEIAKRTGPADD